MSAGAKMGQDSWDFYTGYEGEPELTFLRLAPDGRVAQIRMWIGHFDQIMEHVKPGPQGWTGLALPYHLEAGWYEEDPWSLAQPAEAAAQLSEVDAALLDAESAEVLRRLVRLLHDAAQNREQVQVRYA